MLTLPRDGLELPTLAAMGFAEVLMAMLALVWIAGRYHRRRGGKEPTAGKEYLPVAKPAHTVR